VTTVFVNMLAGPLDMNNGLADLTQAGRVGHLAPVPSTLAGEAARTLIVFSGAIIIPSSLWTLPLIVPPSCGAFPAKIRSVTPPNWGGLMCYSGRLATIFK